MAYKGMMKYFILGNHGDNPFPRVVNWYQILDIKKMNRNSYQELPEFFLLDMKLDMNSFIPDIIVFPFLLLSHAAMEIVSLYDSSIPFRFAALFDTQKKSCVSYYCPIMEEEDCVVETNDTGDQKMRLDRGKMMGIPLFCVNICGEKRTIIRMDLAESLLMRDAIGVELQEIELTKR